ncbi:3 beta-hydroxysteroid dehydrogenase/Delta 5--_4-isomerase [bacterium HR40]|nr:3 beta-hydroxysteroid dehydrogenase/Delta 5-->4-isomerase [bacterium HR40]
MLVAVTGATGFIGRHLTRALAGRARLRLLVRRLEPAMAVEGAEPIVGDLDDHEVLVRLTRGADVVVHAAGLVRARSPEAFDRVNRSGTERLLTAAAQAGVRRILLVSSLAARAPQVSAYAASKAAAEAALLARSGAFEAAIVRPPAVYGPGDKATLEIFRGLARGHLVVPGVRSARFSLIYVEDLAELLAGLALAPEHRTLLLEPDDGRKEGYGWEDIAAIAARALGHPVRLRLVPRPLASAAAGIAEICWRLFGLESPLARDKLGELYHCDWVCRERAGPASLAWRPAVGFAEGVRRTLDWYRAAGWVRPARRSLTGTLGESCR